MRHRSSTEKDKNEIDEGVDADLEWLKREEHAVTSGVPARNSNLTSAPRCVSSSPASKRSSSVTELQNLIHANDSNTNSGARRCKSGGSRNSLQYSAQHNPLFLHEGASHTPYSSLGGLSASRHSNSPGRHASVAAAANLGDPNSLQGLRTHLESISQQLNSSNAVVAELCSGNGMLQQRLSQRSAETQSAVAALLQHNGQLQHQLQNVLVPAQQLTKVSAAARAVESTAGTPATTEGGASAASLTSNERKLVKFLKRLQKDKDRLNQQVQQLLQSQTRLLQQVHESTAKAVASQTSPQRQQATSPLRLKQQQLQHPLCSVSSGGLGRSWMTSTSTCEDDSQLCMQLQQLQQQLDAMGAEQQGQAAAAGGSAVSGGLYDSIGVNRDWLTARQSATCWQQQQQGMPSVDQFQRQEVIEDQAATIVELKKVIAELEQQTTMLRSQSSMQGNSVQALADSQAALSAKQAHIEQLQQQHNEQQELSQAALRDAVRATKAAEGKRDKLQQQLQDESKMRQEAQEAKETFAAEIERLRSERQQLLLRLLEANEQITDLHDELGPAVLRGSPSRARGSGVARASRAWELAEPGWSTSSPNGHSGIGQQLSIAVGELSFKTQAMVAAREAAAKAAKEMQADTRQLQQQYSELQARHQLLTEEHAQLLNRQLGVASERGSLRQQYLATEEQYLAAKKQIFELQNELLLLKANQTAIATRPASASPAGNPDSVQAWQQPLMLSLAADNARLAVALAELMQELDSLKEQLEQQQPGGYLLSAAAAASEVQQQRLQLLVSQLVMVRDQAAGAASVAQLQQEKMQMQQQQVVQLTADLALLQHQHAKLQRDHLQQAQAAVLAAVRAAAGPSSAAVARATEETFKLRLELVNQAEKTRQLAAENESLQAAAIDKVRVEQLDARNRVLLQEVTRLLSDASNLRQQLWAAQSGAGFGAAATAQSSRTASPPPQQQQQHTTVSPAPGVTGSPVSSRHTSRQPSLSQIAIDMSGVTRSPTLSQVTSLSLSQAASLHDQLVSDTAGLEGVTSSVTASPFSVAAASAAHTPGASGSTTPSALRSRSFTEGSKLQVSWSEKLRNDVVATAAVGSSGSQRSSPLGSSKRMSFNQLEQQSGSHGSALDSMLTAVQSTSPTTAPAGSAAVYESPAEDDRLSSRTWSGLQPTPRSNAPSPAAVGATADQPGVVDGSGAPASPSSNRAALIAAVLDRQRSKSSLIASGDGGDTQQQQQQQADFHLTSSNSRSSGSFVGLNSQSASAAASADGSATAAGQDRAALIAAVLQRQTAKHAGDSPSSSFAFAASDGNSVTGATSGYSRGTSAAGVLSAQAPAASLQLQSPAGTVAGKDRASIVAAVLAQRQQKQQQGDGLAAVQAVSASSSLNGSAGAGANRASVTGPHDRAALVAAVLAKHNMGK